MGYCLGIDLGTTNSVASVYRRGQLETIPIDGRPLLPSAVSLKPDGTWLIGQAAKSRAYVEPDATVVSSKRDIGKAGVRYFLPGRTVNPVDVAALVLGRIREAATVLLGPVDEAVITVPAYFDEAQRKATKEAGEAAGFVVRRILTEPTAAAIAYGAEKGRDQTLLVYDLGGGTFDVSILKVDGNDFRVLAVGGDGQLGGDDFDNLIVDWILAQSKIQLESLPSRQAQAARQRLRQAAEAAKIALSESPSAEILLADVGGTSIDLSLTRETYESFVAPLIRRTIDVVFHTLRGAKLETDDIDRVILVGGSTKNHIVQRMIAEAIREPFIAPHVDLVVSHGAALIGASIALPSTGGITATEVMPHPFGTDCLRDGNLVVDHVIPGQSAYPCKHGRLYSARPHQTLVESKVFRGESDQVELCDELGQLDLDIRDPGDHHTLVGVIFELDSDGLLHFTCAQMPFDDYGRELVQYANANGNELPVDQLEALLQKGWGYAERVTVRT